MNSSQNNLLPRIYEQPQTVFSMAGLSMLMNEDREGVLAKRLNYHVHKGNLLNPRRGFYAKHGYNPEELACMMYVPSYLSLEYVLQRSGIVFQYDSRLTAVSYLSRTVTVDGNTITYRRIKGGILADMRGIRREGNINIATPERAMLDVMYLNPEYFFDNPDAADRKALRELLPIYGSKTMEQRVKALFEK